MTEGNHQAARGLDWGVELTPDGPIRAVADLAERAESAGIDTAFVSSHFNNRDAFLALDRIASRTETIRLGPGVANPYDRHPVSLASATATLGEASDGRAVLGLGAGDRSTLRKLGIERDRPVERVEATLEVCRDLWRGEQVSTGKPLEIEAARLSYETGHIPVYLGGQGPRMVRLAARRADGLLANGAHPRDYALMQRAVDRGLENRDADNGEFTFAAFASVSIATERTAAIAAARPPVAFIVAGAPDAAMRRHDLEQERVERIRTSLAAGEHPTAYDAVSKAMIDAFCVAGTPDEVANRIERLREYADAFVAGSPLGPDRAEAIELLADVLSRIGTSGGADE